VVWGVLRGGAWGGRGTFVLECDRLDCSQH